MTARMASGAPMRRPVAIGLRDETRPSVPRRLRVVATESLGPHLRRITCGGDLGGFPAGAEGAHIKIFLRREGQRELHLPTRGPSGVVWPAPALKPLARTYTLSRHDAERSTLSIDFVLHGDAGPASRWALRAREGDELGLAGPGGPNPLLAPADSYLLAGDLSALPAIAALLRAMPPDTSGRALLEVPSPEDMLQLRSPDGMQVHWLFRAPRSKSALPGLVRALELSAHRAFAFVAGESTAVVAIRDHLLRERGYLKEQLYATPYWRESLSEEEYHDERHRIMDELTVAEAHTGAP